MRYLPPFVYLSTIACAVALIAQQDWKTLTFGLAVLIPSAIASLLVLSFPMALLAAIIKGLTTLGVGEQGKQRITVVGGMALNGGVAGAYCVAVFVLFFSTQPVLFGDEERAVLQLAWVSLVACCPWARLTAAEQRIKQEAPLEEFLLVAILIGCACIVWTASRAGVPPTWQQMSLLMAAPLAGIVGMVTLFALHVSIKEASSTTSTPAATCRVHMLRVSSAAPVSEDWVVGENISKESYEKFKDTNGDIYATQQNVGGEIRTFVVTKNRWDKLRSDLNSTQ